MISMNDKAKKTLKHSVHLRSDPAATASRWRTTIAFSDVRALQRHCQKAIQTLGYPDYQSLQELRGMAAAAPTAEKNQAEKNDTNKKKKR